MAVGGEHFGLGPAPDLVVLEDIPQNSFAANQADQHGSRRGPGRADRGRRPIRPRNGRDAQGIRDRHPTASPRVCPCGREHRLRNFAQCPQCMVAVEEQRLELEAVSNA